MTVHTIMLKLVVITLDRNNCRVVEVKNDMLPHNILGQPAPYSCLPVDKWKFAEMPAKNWLISCQRLGQVITINSAGRSLDSMKF